MRGPRDASASTHARLNKTGVPRRNGDIETGIWVCPKTDWYERGDGYVRLKKGGKCEASWTFQSGFWTLRTCDVENIVYPTHAEVAEQIHARIQLTWWQRIWAWFWPGATT